MLDKLAAGIAAWCRAELGVPSVIPAFIKTARAACGSRLFHLTEHATGRRSTRPIVDNVGDLARDQFLVGRGLASYNRGTSQLRWWV
jgi:hypothetical protein